MKRFPELWVLQAGALLILGFSSVLMARAVEQGPSGEYDIVESSRPDGKGGYRGKVTIKEQGPSFAVDWKLKSGENYTGVGILNGDILGVGYGDGLSGLAVYQIKGGTLTAKWLLPATPQQVGEYELTGPASLDGVYRFVNGMKGNVTIKPNGDSYEIAWNLTSGTYTGVGVKMGDTLVAVSGSTDQLFGAVAYHLSSERLQGIWTVAGQNGVGTEVLGTNRMAQPQEIARPGMEAATSSGSHTVKGEK
jgi:hypothetical protein